ncbi:RNA-dependent RNA polymerase [Cordyline virus 4]|uniref:RNA-dependent RNA polymerase n=1 Tax=Cordyline virus 4 TaxID=1177753 RepID=L7P0N3_9CLOS|nr:RNA-dependent RNA polymerase [Cordyline virus 4]AFJ05062.2 RNA-dependent RNA polymerase [Cordyline virus 4]
MDLIFPNMTTYDFCYRTASFEFENMELPIIENVKLARDRSKVYSPLPCTLPKIFGKGERNRPNTWKQVLISLSNRNFAAPDINKDHDTVTSCNILFKGFLKFMDQRKISEYFDVIESDLNKIDEWLTSRDTRKYKNILTSVNHESWISSLNSMKLMVKGELKPKLDNTVLRKYSPPANIVYYEHIVNMYFSPIFLEIFHRISYCLRPNCVIYSGMNLDELGDAIKSRLRFPVDYYYCCEIDFSKFDKSQGIIVKMYEEVVYKFFKFSPNMYDNFKMTEYFSKVRSTCGVNVDLFAQRRTGITTLGILGNYYDLNDFDLVLVAGDDSLLLSRCPIENVTSRINKDFGMEAKFLEQPTSYFCSKFIIELDGKIKVIPDPVRFFEKLSVPIPDDFASNGAVLRERFISYRDLLKEYFCENNIVEIDKKISLKYKTPYFSSYDSCAYIHNLLSSYKNFLKIFLDGDKVLI